MRINDLKESIKGELFDVYFNDYILTINLDTREIHKISKSDSDRIFRLLSNINDKDAINDAIEVQRIYEQYIKELNKETEIEIAEITESYTTILQAALLEYRNKKEKKLKELKDDFKRKR